MSKIIEVTNLLEDKFENFIETFVFLKDENEFLHQRLVELESQIANNQKQLEEKGKDYQLLKVAKTIEGSNESTRETKLKINALIRDIDKCIVQLSE
ncbi:MAG: uncharacterized coiled-coil DUF342 family protein [Urechidicola sp.]|jgi:uncharacterized coiled-coil DUF342 family protein|tara:strand:+ start:164 stop:454 length:291 start_codon:yes stop_codon:yes gene_type:complete